MENTKKLPTEIDFNQDAPQTYFHSTGLGSMGERVVRFYGECSYCKVRTYSHDDGEDDPRGILGNHALGARLDAKDHGMNSDTLPPFVSLCFVCDDDQNKRNVGLKRAVRMWSGLLPLTDEEKTKKLNFALDSGDLVWDSAAQAIRRPSVEEKKKHLGGKRK